MGQKTNPTGFRLITTKPFLSNWYSPKQNYATLIHNDFLIRHKLLVYFLKYLNISCIQINRVNTTLKSGNYLTIIISALYPRTQDILNKIALEYEVVLNNDILLQSFSFLLQQLTISCIRTLQIKELNYSNIQFIFIKNSFTDSTLIAKYIIDQLENRVPYRRIIKYILKKSQKTNNLGIKLQISGRLNGIDIARSEWKREGKIPLHTLTANIDYTFQYAKTIYGIIGIKVWLYKN